MNYSQARSYMEGKQAGIFLGLDRIRTLLDLLGNPEKDLKYIHIAGTNGKGSILSYISTTLTHAGYRVGRYISPTLYSYLERFQINGEEISEDEYVRLAEKIKEQTDVMEEKGLGNPSAFELETVMSILCFKERNCDFVVLECGMGGETDATNVIPSPILAVFSSISMDHMGFLGNSVAEITEVKAGIIKKGCHVVSSQQIDESTRVLEKKAEEMDVSLSLARPDLCHTISNSLNGQTFLYKGYEITISLAGSCQKDNAVTAFECLKKLQELGYELTDSEILEGMKRTVWNGRFTKISDKPLFYVDGAHNEDAAKRLAESIQMYFKGKSIYFINAVFADKEYNKVLKATVPFAKKVFTCQTPDNVRALDRDALKQAVETLGKPAKSCESIEKAIEEAYLEAREDDVILAFGTLSFIGEITDFVMRRGK